MRSQEMSSQEMRSQANGKKPQIQAQSKSTFGTSPHNQHFLKNPPLCSAYHAAIVIEICRSASLIGDASQSGRTGATGATSTTRCIHIAGCRSPRRISKHAERGPKTWCHPGPSDAIHASNDIGGTNASGTVFARSTSVTHSGNVDLRSTVTHCSTVARRSTVAHRGTVTISGIARCETAHGDIVHIKSNLKPVAEPFVS